MNHQHDLPNLLDNHICRKDTTVLIEALGQVRKHVYDAWMSQCKTQRLRRTVAHTIDDAMVLGLLVEYLRRSPVASRKQYYSDLAAQPCISDMARAAQPRGKPAWASFSTLLTGKVHIPAHIRTTIFCDLLPPIFNGYGKQLPITILGDMHQMCLSQPLDDDARDERRTMGAHYTPPSLVDYMVARSTAALNARDTANQISILDPSCGCGAFLVGMLRYIATQSVKSPLNLCGSDIDARAVMLARLSLILSALQNCGHRSPSVPALPGDRDLRVQDYLAADAWRNEHFDLIIGGPPFIRVEQLHKIDPQQVQQYRSRFLTTRSGQFDLYMPFIEKSINLLTPGGVLAFSLSGSFLRNKSGSGLRQFIADNSEIEEIIEFEDGNIYPDASVQIAILLLRRIKVRTWTRYALIPKEGGLRKHLRRILIPTSRSLNGHQILKVCLSDASPEAWPLHSREDARFMDCMDSIGTPLGQLPVQLSLGMCTGADDVFILRRADQSLGRQTVAVAARSGEPLELESAVLRPILRGRHSRLSNGERPAYYCIFPYDATGEVLHEKLFQHTYPMAYRYLLEHKPRLVNRRLCPEQPWYALRKVDVARHVNKPKLIAPTVVSQRGFQYDSHGVLCHHGLITIVSLDRTLSMRYLLGILNSELLWRYISLRSTRMGGDRRVLRLQLAKRLPIIVPKTRVQRSMAAEIVRASRQSMESVCIDEIVLCLYGLK